MPEVVSGFKCPYTGRIYHVGDEYDGEHLDEMIEKGYIEVTKDERSKKQKKGKE